MDTSNELNSYQDLTYQLNERLIQATKQCNTTEIPLLIRAGANINAKDNNHSFTWTALMFAVHNKLIPTMRTLMNEGADVSATDMYGRNALILAIQNGDEYMAFCLLSEMSAEQLKSVKTEFVLQTVEAFEQAVLDIHKKMFALIQYEDCVTENTGLFLANFLAQPLDLKILELSLCFPVWYRDKLVRDFEMIRCAYKEIKEKKEVMHAPATVFSDFSSMLNQAPTYVPSFVSQFKAVAMKEDEIEKNKNARKSRRIGSSSSCS